MLMTYWGYSNSFHIGYSSGAAKHSNISREGRLQTRLACFAFQTLYKGLCTQKLVMSYAERKD